MADDFEATIRGWAKMTEETLIAVVRDAAQSLFNDVRVPIASGGNMPVLTGNLRRSAAASLSEPIAINTDGKQKYGSDGGANVTLTIASAKLGDSIYIGFQANYAPYMENRYGFVRLAAQDWPKTVKDSVRRITGK